MQCTRQMTSSVPPLVLPSRDAPSDRYLALLEMYKHVHTEGIAEQNISADDCFAGTSLGRHLQTIRKLIAATGARTVLDYGSGKGVKYKARNIKIKNERAESVQHYWGVETITCYDPGYGPYSALPRGQFDAVVCTDVLEHLPESDLPWIMEEQFRFAKRFVFGNIASYPAEKILPNGENAHCTIQDARWWHELIRKARDVARSRADYLFLVETKKTVRQYFGLKKKVVPQYEWLSSRADWRQ